MWKMTLFLRRYNYKPSFVSNNNLSSIFFTKYIKQRASIVKLIPPLLAAGWVYIAAKITQSTGGLLPRRFTFSSYLTKIEVVYFLLHCPLGYPSHTLDGTILHSSSDFPLVIQAIVCCTFKIISRSSYFLIISKEEGILY